MRWSRTISIGCVTALATSLLLAHVHPFGNAGLYEAKSAQVPIMKHLSTPPQVPAILLAKCADCHSMQTRTPFYGRFSPASWLMERDIIQGRKKMNLSLWDTYSADQQEILKAEIVQEMKEHKMPPLQYRIVHWDTKIDDADLRNLTQWAHEVPVLEVGSMSKQSTGEGDPVKGKEVFEKRCTGCHAMTQNREGPKLQGVYGRASGEVAAFGYSSALKKAQIVWNDKTLEQWLIDPDTLVPGNNMEFHVAKPQERQDLIGFLKQNAGK